jgi:hypothetical protein
VKVAANFTQLVRGVPWELGGNCVAGREQEIRRPGVFVYFLFSCCLFPWNQERQIS